MAQREPDDDIDALYALPLGEFISARNALARRAGPAGAAIRALQKPTLPAWAVNQLYWQERKTYEALVARARDLRATHDAVLRGKAGDVRGASRAHEEAVETALKTTLALLAGSGETVTDATRQAIATTLRGLPAEEAPGRLVRPLQPRGFGMLAGALAPGRVRPAAAPAPARGPAPAEKRNAARAAEARQALAAAARGVKEAEQGVRREEFDAARAARDAEKAQRRVADAQRALEEAQSALAEAEKAAAAAARARDAAQARAGKAAGRLAAARDREAAAQEAVDALE